MTPGDIPCNAPCSWRWCRFWCDGHCMDNETCEKQTQTDLGEPDERDYGEIDTDNENETEDGK